MKQIIVIFGLAIFLSAQVLSDSDHDHEEARALRLNGDILPLIQILDVAKKAELETILEVELEKENNQWIYEVEGLSKHNQLIEISIDALTGNIVETEYKKRRHGKGY